MDDQTRCSLEGNEMTYLPVAGLEGVSFKSYRFRPVTRLSPIVGWLLLFVGTALSASVHETGVKISAVVDANYPGGNIIVERIEGDAICLQPDMRDTEGWWFYWNFRVRGAQGRTLTFRFSGDNPIGVRGPAVSTDGGRSWSWLGSEAVQDASFKYAFPANGGKVNSLPVQIGGVFPSLTVMAKGVGSNSEAGIGALIPWAQKLWAVGYVAHISGDGLGLYEINEDMTMRRHPASVTGTFANRMVHWPSGQAFIGPYTIDADGNVRVIEDLKCVRLAATCEHLSDPANKVYFLGMEGRFWEVDVHTLEATLLFDLVKELGIDATPHFKSGYTAEGRVVVANNTYDEQEFLGKRDAGRLAEWDGKKWTIIERNPFVEVHGSASSGSYGGNTIYATGWTRSSVVLRAFVKGKWQRYLLPKASQTWEHAWNTEWMRIRHAVTERLLMDVHGMFYELPPFSYGGHIWGIRPICSHLRVVPDFCYWRGLFVMASDQIDHDQGQPQSGLWFGNIDDLWRMGKPAGWGGPWWNTPVKAGEVSDPFLMTGFDKKVVHIAHDANEEVTFVVEVDFLGDGSWRPYKSFTVSPPENYAHHEFPDGFSAHWVRVRVDKDCVATVYLFYN